MRNNFRIPPVYLTREVVTVQLRNISIDRIKNRKTKMTFVVPCGSVHRGKIWDEEFEDWLSEIQKLRTCKLCKVKLGLWKTLVNRKAVIDLFTATGSFYHVVFQHLPVD